MTSLTLNVEPIAQSVETYDSDMVVRLTERLWAKEAEERLTAYRPGEIKNIRLKSSAE